MSFLWMLEGLRTPLLNQIMQWITDCGQGLITLLVICILYWCVDKRFAYLLGLTYFSAGICVQTLKITFRIPRPWILDPDFKAVESAVPGATGYSFPSGHTQNATCLFFPLALKTKKYWLKGFYILAFLLIGFSRMYLGCHTPKDVFVSMVISILFSLFIWRYQNFILDSEKGRKYTALALLLVSGAVTIYALLLKTNGIIDTKYALDCCRTSGAGIGFACGWYLEQTSLHFSTQTRHVWSQVLKVVVGIVTILLLREIISLILGGSVIAKFLEYFILVIWILILYPMLFTYASKMKLK